MVFEPARFSSPLPPPQIEALTQNVSGDRKHPLILTIDDDPVTVKLATKYLQADGYEVLTASNGERGWELICEHKPDLVISDWSMPDISGVVLCHRVKANPNYPELQMCYFILLTAHSDINYRVIGLDAGADEFIMKPVDASELRARVRAGLRLSRLTKSLAIANQRLIARNELLASLSLTDPLTGLLNRRALDEALPHFLALPQEWGQALSGRSFCLLVVDIDSFKQINDTYGHAAGDEVLRAVAGRLQSHSDPNSLLYRYGGEEFVCVTPNTDVRHSHALAHRLLHAISEHPIALGGGLIVPVTVSIGGATVSPNCGLTPQDLFVQADGALYQAKRGGKNCVRLLACVDRTVEEISTDLEGNHAEVAG